MNAIQAHIEATAALLRGVERLVVLTGAGISKESGLATFREPLTGIWARYDPVKLGTRRSFQRDPKLVWDFLAFLHAGIAGAEPNPGHYAIAELEALIPEVVVITQNIDNLHQKAGSTDVIELHGSFGRNKCFADCRGNPTYVSDEEALPGADGAPPRCPHCGAYIRPDVVLFEETLPPGLLGRAKWVSRASDVMLVVGTSGIVQPAASLPYWAVRAGAKLIDVNPGMDEIGPAADVFIQAPAGEALPLLVEMLRHEEM
ncbi:MAG: NAD-dependent deacylase [Anaerolineae bacterium]|nr:NAD-dependent deacylase [Anaerolineae bacterium]